MKPFFIPHLCNAKLFADDDEPSLTIAVGTNGIDKDESVYRLVYRIGIRCYLIVEVKNVYCCC